MTDFEQRRYHGFPGLGEVLFKVAVGVLTAPVVLPYRAIKKKIDKKKADKK